MKVTSSSYPNTSIVEKGPLEHMPHVLSSEGSKLDGLVWWQAYHRSLKQGQPPFFSSDTGDVPEPRMQHLPLYRLLEYLTLWVEKVAPAELHY